jgi:phage shock protein A
MKLFFSILITLSLTSAIWLLHERIQREKIRQLNYIIEEAHETMNRQGQKHADVWKSKNEAWRELNRIKLDGKD